MDRHIHAQTLMAQPGQRAQEIAGHRLRGCAALNQSELARRLGVSPQAVQKWESGKSTPRHAKLGDIASILGTSVSYLVQGSEAIPAPPSNAVIMGDIDTWDETTPVSDDELAVPFLREVELAAGVGRFAIQEDTTESLRFPKKKLRDNRVQFDKARCLTVRGNSMTPVLRDGATVGVDLGKNTLGDVVDGELYALNHAGQLRVKQLYRLPAGIRLRSFNRDEHPDEDYAFEHINAGQLLIIGHVFWWAMYAR